MPPRYSCRWAISLRTRSVRCEQRKQKHQGQLDNRGGGYDPQRTKCWERAERQPVGCDASLAAALEWLHTHTPHITWTSHRVGSCSRSPLSTLANSGFGTPERGTGDELDLY